MQTLHNVLRDKVLARLESSASVPIIVASTQLLPRDLPREVKISRKKLKGQRRARRGKRKYGGTGDFLAKWPDDYLVETRSGAKLGVVIEGQADLQIADRVLHCPAGTLLFFPPGVPHPDGKLPHLEGKRSGDEKEFANILWLTQRWRGVECWMCFSRGHRHWGQQTHGMAFIMNQHAVLLLKQAQDIAELAEPESLTVCRYLLLALFTIVRNDLASGSSLRLGQVAHEPDNFPRNWDPVQEAQKYIRIHLSEHLTIDQVAREVHMSRTQFVKRFREETGQSFVEFQNQCRLEEAKTLLLRTEWSIENISQHVGLKDAAYFGELFRKGTDLTPTAYRLKNSSKAQL